MIDSNSSATRAIQTGARVQVVGTHFVNHGQVGTVESVDADGATNDFGEPMSQYARVIIDGGGQGSWVYPVASLKVVR